MRRTLPTALLIFVVLVVSLTGQASGHALLVRSDPTPNSSLQTSPIQVTIWFSEQLNSLSSTIKVLDSSGSQVDGKDVAVSPDHLSMSVSLLPLNKGVYTVSWISVSAVDGHLSSGSFPFGIGVVVPPPPSSQPGIQPSLVSLIPESVARWSFYLGQTILVGGLFFYLLVISPSFVKRRKKVPQGGQVQPSLSQSPLVSQSSVQRVFIASLIGAGATVAGLTVLVAEQTNNAQAASTTSFLLGTQLGLLDTTRFLLVGISSVCIFLALRMAKPTGVVTLSLFSGLVSLFATSLAGHDAAVGGGYVALSVLADWVHLVGVSVWIGGLIMLSLIMLILKREGQLSQGLLRLVPRFSRIAIISVGMIAVSGLYATLYQIGSFSALFGTEYGQTLVVKIVLTGVLVVLGGSNQFVWYPRLVKAFRTLGLAQPSVLSMARRLSRSIRTEVLIGLVLILVVGVLTSLPTGIQINQIQNRPTLQATTFTQQSGGLTVALAVYPFHVGANSFSVTTKDQNGNLVPGIVRVILDFTWKDGALSPGQANSTTPDNNGAFVVQGQFLSEPGNWNVEVSVTRSGVADTIVYYAIYLPEYLGIDTAKVWEVPYTDTTMNGYDTLVDGSNNIWFTAPFPGVLGRFQPGGDSYQIYSPNYANASPGKMAMDNKGKIWYIDQLVSAIVSFNPSTSQFTKYDLPHQFENATLSGITLDRNDSIWVTEQLGVESRVLAFNQTGIKSATPFVNKQTPTNSSAIGPIVIDGQNRVWFARDLPTPGSSSGHGGGLAVIDMFDMTTDNITEYRPPANASFVTGIAVGPSANGDIWFAEHATNRLSYISPSNGFAITQLSLDTSLGDAFPWGLEFDPQGNIWLSEHIGNKIAFYDLGTKQFREWPIPTSNSDSKLPAIDQFGNVWFAEGQGNLGVLALQPNAIGLGGQTPDIAYQVTVGGLMIVIGLVTIRWQSLVRFFSDRRRQPGLSPTDQHVKKQSSSKKPK